MTTLLGLAVIYLIIHLIVICFLRGWSNMNTYEKFVTIAGTVGIALLIFSTAS